MRISKVALATVLTIVVVAGCGGGGAAPTGAAGPTSGSAQASGPAATAAGGTGSPAPVGAGTPAPVADPVAVAKEMCTLLTPADIKTATGADYGAGVPDEFGNCIWRVGSATVNDGKGQVAASISPATLENIKGMFAGGTDLTVGGHPAYWNPGDGLGAIWVDVDGRVLAIALSPIPDDGGTLAAKLAEVAVGRM